MMMVEVSVSILLTWMLVS